VDKNVGFCISCFERNASVREYTFWEKCATKKTLYEIRDGKGNQVYGESITDGTRFNKTYKS